MKRVFIVHGWGGSPKEAMLAWLGKELEKKKINVHMMKMPHPDTPTIKDWVSHLAHEVKNPDHETYFIGHSVGCQTVLRYIETLNVNVGGAVLIAPWFSSLHELETDEEIEIAKPWIETPINFRKVKENLPLSVAIFSDNDPFVPLDEKEILRERLNSEIYIEHKKGHFTESDNVKDLHAALQAILSLVNHTFK